MHRVSSNRALAQCVMPDILNHMRGRRWSERCPKVRRARIKSVQFKLPIKTICCVVDGALSRIVSLDWHALPVRRN